MGFTLGTCGATGSTGWTVVTPSGTPQNGYGAGPPASGNTMIIFVSAAGNDTTGDGSSTAPYATIAKGFGRLRAGQPDWLLLRKGDTWTGADTNMFTPIGFGGLNSNERVVISSYDPALGFQGSSTQANPSSGGARPLLKVPGSGGCGYQDQRGCSNVALMGLEFYSYQCDPDGGAYNAALLSNSAWGITVWNSPDSVLIEDCFVHSFYENMYLGATGTITNLVVRRNVIADAFYGDINACFGVGFGNSTGAIFEENVIDHNGWNATAAQPTTLGTMVRAHNIYGGWADVQNATYRYNIFARAPAADKLFGGGDVINNLYVACPIGFGFGQTQNRAYTISNNVFSELSDYPFSLGVDGKGFNPQARANGLDINLGTVSVTKNIFANTSAGTGNGPAILLSPGANGHTLSRNIVYKWGAPTNTGATSGSFQHYTGSINTVDTFTGTGTNGTYNTSGIATTGGTGTGAAVEVVVSGGVVTSVAIWKGAPGQSGGSGDSSGYGYTVGDILSFTVTGGSGTCRVASLCSNTVDGTNTDDYQGLGSYPDHTRTVATWSGSQGFTATVAGFLAQARLQSKANWRTACTADSVNNWIRSGFGLNNTAGGNHLGKF